MSCQNPNHPACTTENGGHHWEAGDHVVNTTSINGVIVLEDGTAVDCSASDTCVPSVEHAHELSYRIAKAHEASGHLQHIVYGDEKEGKPRCVITIPEGGTHADHFIAHASDPNTPLTFD